MNEAAANRELVVLVHGLWMAGPVWTLFMRRLRRAGYQVASFSYPSVRQTLDESARALEAFARARHARRVHFVGHSLGGLVVLRMLSDAGTLAAGRVVLLGSPAAGSGAVEQLRGTRTGRVVLGAALPAWRAEYGVSVASRLQVGAIAGTRRFGLGLLLVQLPPPNDGVVAVEETRLAGLADHLVLPVSHSGMIVSAQVASEVANFLHGGRFSHLG